MPRRRMPNHAARRVATLIASCLVASAASAQDRPSSDKLRIGGEAASSWSEGATRVLLVEGNATITADDSTLSADRAVIWLTPDPAGGYEVKVALAGKARVVRGDVTREGGELYVTLATRPDVTLSVDDLANRDRRTDVRYLAAAQLRRQAERGEVQRPVDLTPQPATAPSIAPSIASGETVYDPTTRPVAEAATQPTSRPAVTALPPPSQGTVSYRSARAQTTMTPDGFVALVLSGDVLLVQQRSNGDRVELQAQNAVLYTKWTNVRQILEAGEGVKADRDFDAVYLEQDVRIGLTPGDAIRPEQKLRASRAVYEFGTDRAVLTDALLHSYDPAAQAPLVMRATEMRKLGTDTYEADRAAITTSNFATPSMSLSASKVTVRQATSNNGSTRTVFRADHVTPRVFGVPVFWFPVVYGTSTDGGLPIRDISLSNSGGFGTGIATNWGLFETFGKAPPPGVDASYRLDYYTERGPALGFDTNYAGGFISETSLQPWSFNGGLTAYGVLDSGSDKLGRRRGRPTFEDDFRGRVKWQHQQFLTDGWQVQAQAAYTSDPTFLEEWFRGEFRNGQEQDTSILVKRSIGNEVLSLYASENFSKVATVADQMQEVAITSDGAVPITVERLPQVEYHRLGESFAEDRLTLVSNNSATALHFQASYANLTDYGFKSSPVTTSADDSFPGLPSYGYTGYTDDYVMRGDTRQEIAMPLGNDRFRVTPFGVVRYTAYSDSPGGDAEDRLLAGIGVRMSTQFFKTFDDVHSTLFDLNRVRHIVEPQLNLFASAQSTDRNELFVYDESIDGISDVVGAQLVLKQRFQTKRGGEGRYRSVDFLTFNVGANVFANQESEPDGPVETFEFNDAGSFRGLYFSALPEASVPRSTLFADAVWRVTDTTALLGDTSWNIEDQSLATAALGLAVRRDPRTSYFAGVRYIGEINSTIGTFTFDYDISERYSIAFNQSFNLSEGQNQSTSMEVVRRFEQFIFTVTMYFDRIEDEGGIQFSISPRNFPVGINTRGRPTGRT